jgi:hypothetical protein
MQFPLIIIDQPICGLTLKNKMWLERSEDSCLIKLLTVGCFNYNKDYPNKRRIISTDIVGVAEEVRENNCRIIIKLKDSKDLAKAIVKILKNPKLAKNGEGMEEGYSRTNTLGTNYGKNWTSL